MGYYAKLIHGAYEIDLTVAPFALASNYQPPAMTTDVQMSVGTAQNKSGGREIQRTPRDRRFDLPLRIEGASAAETHGAVRRVVDFIQRGLADKSEKLYFVYGPSDAVPYEPRWGQQFLHYEIKSISDPDLTRLYNIAELRSKTFFISLPLTIGPYALGHRQIVGSGTGGLIERTWATGNGTSRGLGILTARTNEVANPIFGNATYDTGYTVGAGAIKAKNTDKKYVLFGEASAKVTSIDTSNKYIQVSVNLAASTSVMGFVVKNPDGSAVTSADATMDYSGTGLTESYLSIGDGWYVVYGNATGSGGATNLVLYLADYATLYIGYVFAEVGTFPIIPNYGDLLDNAWAGTAHNSDSTRTAGRLRFAATDLLDYARGSISFRWIAGVSSDVAATIAFLDATGADEFVFYFDHASNVFTFNINAGTAVSSTAKTFAVGDVMIFHLVWEPGRMEVYLNGASIASGSAYTIPTYGDYLYIGNDDGGSYPTNGYYSDLISWNVALSDAEVLAHYNDISEHINGGDGLGQVGMPIPWAWFDQGDDILDNDYDTGSSLYNFFYAGGIPGTEPAQTEWRIQATSTAFEDEHALYFSIVPYGYKNVNSRNNDDIFQASGATVSISTTETSVTTSTGPVIHNIEQYNQNYYIYTRCIDAGSNLQARFYYLPDNLGIEGIPIQSTEYISFTPHASTYKGFMLGPFYVSYNQAFTRLDISKRAEIGLTYRRSSGAAANITTDYRLLMIDPIRIYFAEDMDDMAFVLVDKDCYAYEVSTGDLYAIVLDVTGKVQNLKPGLANQVWAVIGDTATANTTTRTTTWKIYITPKWSLL